MRLPVLPASIIIPYPTGKISFASRAIAVSCSAVMAKQVCNSAVIPKTIENVKEDNDPAWTRMFCHESLVKPFVPKLKIPFFSSVEIGWVRSPF
jgi:hypothetical protein